MATTSEDPYLPRLRAWAVVFVARPRGAAHRRRDRLVRLRHLRGDEAGARPVPRRRVPARVLRRLLHRGPRRRRRGARALPGARVPRRRRRRRHAPGGVQEAARHGRVRRLVRRALRAGRRPGPRALPVPGLRRAGGPRRRRPRRPRGVQGGVSHQQTRLLPSVRGAVERPPRRRRLRPGLRAFAARQGAELDALPELPRHDRQDPRVQQNGLQLATRRGGSLGRPPPCVPASWAGGPLLTRRGPSRNPRRRSHIDP